MFRKAKATQQVMSATKTYRINEIFYSLQGEGYYTGTPAVFLRFSGCNRKCSFCDTDHSGGSSMTADEIAEACAAYPSSHRWRTFTPARQRPAASPQGPWVLCTDRNQWFPAGSARSRLGDMLAQRRPLGHRQGRRTQNRISGRRCRADRIGIRHSPSLPATLLRTEHSRNRGLHPRPSRMASEPADS